MKRLAVVVLVLAALLLVADRVAERVAEGALAEQLTGELGSRPAVEIGGFPFLTQAVAGRYDDLRVRAGRVERSGLSLTDFSAVLTGTQLPLADAARGDVSSVPVQQLAASGVLPYAELERLAGTGLSLEADPQGVRVSGTVRVLGRDVAASAVGAVTLQGDRVVVRPRDIEVAGVRATGAVSRALAGRLDLDVRLPTLPYGVQLTTLRSGPQGLEVSGSARDVLLRR